MRMRTGCASARKNAALKTWSSPAGASGGCRTTGVIIGGLTSRAPSGAHQSIYCNIHIYTRRFRHDPAPDTRAPDGLRAKTRMTTVMAFPGSVPLPKLVETLRGGYSAGAFLSDLIAGVTVGLVALPLAMAFAIASGVPPQNGIYCAVVAGFVISALGGSRTQIGGPTGAFVVVVAGIVSVYGLDGLFMCTLMAGVILIVLGVTGLGSAVKFIPRPVVIGFTNGIGI